MTASPTPAVTSVATTGSWSAMVTLTGFKAIHLVLERTGLIPQFLAFPCEAHAFRRAHEEHPMGAAVFRNRNSDPTANRGRIR